MALSADVSSAVPAGTILVTARTAAPTGYVLCYGQALNTFTYKDLHAAITNTYGGTAYNAGVTDQSGVSTTFNVPDLRGRVVAGQDDMGGSSGNRLTNQTGGLDGDTLGATGGSETHTLTEAQLPAHTHGPGTLKFKMSDQANGSSNRARNRSDAVDLNQFDNTLTGATGSTGSDAAHNNVQPTIILNYMIKT